MVKRNLLVVLARPEAHLPEDRFCFRFVRAFPLTRSAIAENVAAAQNRERTYARRRVPPGEISPYAIPASASTSSSRLRQRVVCVKR